MKIIKVSTLSGAALDWAVANCEGAPEYLLDKPWRASELLEHYSTDWAQGGPIIEREEVYLSVADNKHWWAEVRRMDDGRQAYHTSFQKSIVQEGPTPLIAAMRCYVASKFGNEMEIPDELLYAS